MEKLLEQLNAISSILEAPILNDQISRNRDIEKKVEDHKALVEKLSTQQDNFLLSDDNLKITLNEIKLNLEALSEECDLNLERLDFLKNIR